MRGAGFRQAHFPEEEGHQGGKEDGQPPPQPQVQEI